MIILRLCALVLMVSAPAVAHEVRPARLEVTETEPGNFTLNFMQPQAQGKWLNISVTPPETCVMGQDPQKIVNDTSVNLIWTMICTDGLQGRRFEFPGLERTLTDVFTRVVFLSGEEVTGLANPANPYFDLADSHSLLAYVKIGFWHILNGLDHVLFVLLLVLLIDRLPKLLKAVSAFTIAHSLTLGLSAMRVFAPPQGATEVVIALSIAFLAYEVVLRINGRTTTTTVSPWIPAFLFGLHGFGFAGALSEIGLPYGARLQALFLFNVGVEFGQLAIICLTFPILVAIRRAGQSALKWSGGVTAYACGGLAVFWCIERLVST